MSAYLLALDQAAMRMPMTLTLDRARTTNRPTSERIGTRFGPYGMNPNTRIPGINATAGASGSILHASGVPMDARKDDPYCFYDQVDFDVPTGSGGDSYDRFSVLLARMRQSLRIIEQVHERIPPGPVNVKLPKAVKAPPGSYYVRMENPLGQLSYYLVSHGEKTPWRLKMRTPSFNNVSVLPYLLEGSLMPDMIAIMGSVFFIVGDIDR